VWRYLKHMLRIRLRTPYEGEDVRQLGGDFIVNRRGEVLYAYRDPDPTHRPTVDALLAACRGP
jgi:hypothetical protein